MSSAACTYWPKPAATSRTSCAGAVQGLADRIADAAIDAYCVDVTLPRPPGPVCTAAWPSPPPTRQGGAQGREDPVVELRHARQGQVATSIRLQALLRASRAPTSPAQAGHAAWGGKPSRAEQAAATVLYEQIAFGERRK